MDQRERRRPEDPRWDSSTALERRGAPPPEVGVLVVYVLTVRAPAEEPERRAAGAWDVAARPAAGAWPRGPWRRPDRVCPPREDEVRDGAAAAGAADGFTRAASSPTSRSSTGVPARTDWGVAVIFAWRDSARKSDACSGSTRVTTSPVSYTHLRAHET